ncbi:MAG: DUF4870 domain-containing protein [Planctomycetes bacterium]|nr:DUF4870 domain-containing protein [Planctomycetota bacterium]
MGLEDTRPFDRERPPRTADDEDDAGPRVQVKAEATCPLCLEALTSLPRLEVCPGCRTIHHAGCVDEFRRCGTPGCRGLSAPRATVAERGDPEETSERSVAAVAHLANVLGVGLLLPLVIYWLTRERQAFASHHAWRALVFSLWSIPLTFVTLGLWVPVMIVLNVRAALRAWRGEWVPYARRRVPSSDRALEKT